MKKILSILFVAISLISCSNDEDFSQKNNTSATEKTTANKLAAGVNVKLVRAFTSYDGLYGYAAYSKRFKVEVKNLAYDKKVVIMHKMADGSWKDFPLSYLSSTSDNSEIWGADLFISNSLYVGDTPSLLFSDEFVVRYEANGVQYWDNNDSKNYKMGDLEGTYLRSDLNVSSDTYYSKIYTSYPDYTGVAPVSNSFSVHVDVRNISPTKLVTVVYTTDNWATTKTASLSYMQTMTVGARQWITSPNRFGIERWSVNIDIPATVDTIQYAVVYKVNGVEYWDNNFGKNYNVKK